MLALFAAGFSTFALMYCMQPLLPELATTFGVSAAASSLTVSLTTGVLSATLLLSGSVSERVARKTLMVASLCATALLTMLCATATSWTTFLVMRALAGIAFAGLPAIAMAYVGEEISQPAAGLGMGIYVAGTAVGGMSGRILAATLTDAFGWRVAVGASGGFGVVAAVMVAAMLPQARHIRPGARATESLLAVYLAHLADAHLRRLFAQGFLFMGVFVAVYNYLTFRLVAPPYALGHTAIGLVFLLYLVGMVSSPWAGAMAGVRGRRRTLGLSLVLMLVGVALTLLTSLAAIMVGAGLLTFGFFAAHAVTSTWIGLRARGRQAQAACLYIVCYYLGASVTGTLAGVFWARFGWKGVAGFVLAQTVAALALLRSTDAD
jgi:YNFM family putative membrane transporter